MDHDVAARLRAKTGRSRSSRALIGTAALALTGLALAGCTANEAFFFDLPEPASAEAPDHPEPVATARGSPPGRSACVTWGLNALGRYFRVPASARINEVPEQTKYNLPLEALYTVVPLIMVLGLVLVHGTGPE